MYMRPVNRESESMASLRDCAAVKRYEKRSSSVSEAGLRMGIQIRFYKENRFSLGYFPEWNIPFILLSKSRWAAASLNLSICSPESLQRVQSSIFAPLLAPPLKTSAISRYTVLWVHVDLSPHVLAVYFMHVHL